MLRIFTVSTHRSFYLLFAHTYSVFSKFILNLQFMNSLCTVSPSCESCLSCFHIISKQQKVQYFTTYFEYQYYKWLPVLFLKFYSCIYKKEMVIVFNLDLMVLICVLKIRHQCAVDNDCTLPARSNTYINNTLTSYYNGNNITVFDCTDERARTRMGQK